MSNNNNFVLIIRDSNKECPMKRNYLILIFLSIIEILAEFFFFKIIFPKEIYIKIIFLLLFILSVIYLIFSIFYTKKFKLFSKKPIEINNIINQRKIKSYKKITKFLMIIGILIGITYFSFIFIYFCFWNGFFPTCDDIEYKKRFQNILNLKACESNICYNMKNNYINQENFYKNNYLCNFRISKYLDNKIECLYLPKQKKNDINSTSNSLNIFYNERNTTISKNIYTFLASCDYDFNKYLYICNSLNELNSNKNLNYSIINDYNENNNSINSLKKNDNEINYNNNEECITVTIFFLYMILNLSIFFTLPIKVDIWYNEYRRYEIIKKEIHPNRLRLISNNNNNIDRSNLSDSTDNSSENNSHSNVNINSQIDSNNNIFEVVIN